MPSKVLVNLVKLDARLRTPRGHAGLRGSGHDLSHAYLRAALTRAGVRARQLVNPEPRVLERLAADAARRADVVVLRAGPDSPALVDALGEAVHAARPAAAVVLSGVPSDQLAITLAARPWAAAALDDDGEDGIVALARGLREGATLAPAAELTVRGLAVRAPDGTVVAPPDGADTGGDLVDLPSPWLGGLLPVSAAERLGVETARLRPGGRLRRHPAHRILEELAWIDERAAGARRVPLVGALFPADPDGAAALCGRIAAAGFQRLRLAATIDPATATPALLRAAAAAGVDYVTSHVQLDARTAGGEDGGLTAALADALAALAEAAAEHGITLAGHLTIPPDLPDGRLLEQTLRLLEAHTPAFTFDLPPAGSRAARLLATTPAGAAVWTATWRARQAHTRAVRASVRQLASGLSPRRDPLGYADAARRLYWSGPPPAPDEVAWLRSVVAIDGLYLEREEPTAVSVHAAAPPAGERHPVRQVPQPATTRLTGSRPPTAAGPGATPPPTGQRQTGQRAPRPPHEVRRLDVAGDAWAVAGYRAARAATHTVPTILQVDDPDDLAVFLADADTAHAGGGFPPGLTHPLAVLADACRWRGAEDCAATARLERLLVTPDRQVHPGGLAGAGGTAPLGTVGEPFETLLARARGRGLARGCAACPAETGCTACACVPAGPAGAAWCAARRERPWLALYAVLPDALRGLADADPDTARRGSLARLRVSGFGGSLFAGDPPTGGALPGDPHDQRLLLLGFGDRFYAYGAATGRLARLPYSAAVLCEALLHSPDVDAAAGWLAPRARLGLDAATAALRTTRQRLEAGGLLPALAA